MKKLPLVLGTLGGGLAGYLFSNRKLRDELSGAKDAKAAAKVLGAHLSKDGEHLAKDVKEFLDSDMVQEGIENAKKYAYDHYKTAKKEVQKYAKSAPALAGAKRSVKAAKSKSGR